MTDLIDRQKSITEQLVKGFPDQGIKGWPLTSSCASVGNATQESNCQPVIASADGSNGLWQWRGTRLTGLYSFAATRGLDWKLMPTQVAYHMMEMQRDYTVLYAELIEASKPIETLTANICNSYERPDARYANLDNRIKAAKATYAAMLPPVHETPIQLPQGNATMSAILSFIFARLNEKSTVAGLVGAFFAAIHFAAPAVLQADLTNAIIAVMGVIMALVPTS